MTALKHPYSVYVWYPPLSLTGRGHWTEELQAFSQQYTLYVANLIHQDSHAVLKVVRYGHNIQCWPDMHTVEMVEQQITRQEQREQERLQREGEERTKRDPNNHSYWLSRPWNKKPH